MDLSAPARPVWQRSRAARERQSRLTRLAAGVGALLVAVGVIVLLGWILDVEVMKSFGPGLVPMKVHTAFSMIEVGVLIVLATRYDDLPWAPWVSAAVAVVPILTLVEYLTGNSLGIDNIFGADHVPVADNPGRMSPMTAVGLTTLAIGLAATFLRRPLLAQYAGVVTALVSLVALTGYAFGVESLYRVQVYSSIAVNTAACLGLAAAAILALNTSAGILSVLVGTTAGGVVGRALLPPAMIFQVLVCGLVLLGVTQGLYDYRFGFALVAVSTVIGGAALVLLLAFVLRTSDLRRAGAEAALQQAHEESAELVAANAVLSDFAAMAAHDLRGPLAAVRGFSELLEESLEDPVPDRAEQMELILRIQHSAERGDEMITDMLEFAQLGARAPEPVEVDLAAVVRSVTAELRSAFERPLRVEAHDLPHLYADPSLLRLLVTNVLGNAAKYVPADREARVVVTRVRNSKGEVVIRFADNGDGIAPGDRERLMQMFERGATSSDVPGTGIGLAICARVAEVHGGRFWIEAEPGGGARFCLTLPERLEEDAGP